jgi:enoyl-CoA hydratase/carnithine racemase
MNNGENRHNPDFTKAMMSVYNEVLADEEVKAIVLTSSDEKNFSLGVDLQWMMEMQQKNDYPGISQWLKDNNQVFRAMLMAPVPTIAAITGHAFGNGAMLAGACDFRFMRSDRGYLCLPEVDLGIQFTPSMIAWMKKAIPYHFFVKMKWSGMKVGAKELEENRVVLQACEGIDATVAEAVAFGKTFQKSRPTLAEMKRRTYKEIIDTMENEDPEYIEYRPENEKEGKSPIFLFTPL